MRFVDYAPIYVKAKAAEKMRAHASMCRDDLCKNPLSFVSYCTQAVCIFYDTRILSFELNIFQNDDTILW